MKGNLPLQTVIGRGKDPAKGLIGGDLALVPDTSFFTAKQKGKDFAPKGRKKDKNKDKDKGGYKSKGTGKDKDCKG